MTNTGKFKGGNEELEKILQDHQIWLKSNGEKGERADLRNLDFSNSADLTALLRHYSLKNADLSHTDFSNQDLSGVIFKGAKLENANFNGAKLNNAHMENISADRINLSYADISNAYFDGAVIQHAQMNSTHANMTSFAHADMDFSDIRSMIAINADFTDASMRNVEAMQTTFRNACFKNADLSGADLFQSSMPHTNISGANLEDADMREANTNQIILDKETGFQETMLYGTSILCDKTYQEVADLSEIVNTPPLPEKIAHMVLENERLNHTHGKEGKLASFKGMDLTGMDFRNRDLAGADFSDAILKNASFNHAIFGRVQWHDDNCSPSFQHRETSFKNAHVNAQNIDMRNTELSGAYITDSNFSNSKCINATLNGANIINSDFSVTNWHRADLYDVNISGTKISDIQNIISEANWIDGKSEQNIKENNKALKDPETVVDNLFDEAVMEADQINNNNSEMETNKEHENSDMEL